MEALALFIVLNLFPRRLNFRMWRGSVSPPANAPDGTMKHRLSKKVRGSIELSYLAEYH